jgi:amino-acid N-acetyltransferase
MRFRPATVADVPAVHLIINDAAEYGLMLPKSLATLYENVRELTVAVDGEEPAEGASGGVVGVCGLSIVWANLAEVVSLAVDPSQRGQGVGGRLVEACLEEARRLGIARAMTLTYEQRFFEKLGFEVVDRAKLPMKVWAECVMCPKHDACDEVAMMRVIEGVPDAAAPKPPERSESGGRYEVPVQVSLTKSG